LPGSTGGATFALNATLAALVSVVGWEDAVPRLVPRSRSVLVGGVVALLLCGCQGGVVLGGGSPAPTPTSTSSGAALPDSGGSTIGGSAEASFLGDPCNLITSEEVAAATGVAVLGVVRGEADPTTGHQVCAFEMDAGGATEAALGSYVGTVPGGELGSLIDGMGTAGGVVGVVIDPTDPDMMEGDSSEENDAPPPNIEAVTLDLGIGGVAVATPNGGAAFAATERATITIMNLIAGPTSTEIMTSLVTTAFARMS
jgi:hypothetical protein